MVATSTSDKGQAMGLTAESSLSRLPKSRVKVRLVGMAMPPVTPSPKSSRVKKGNGVQPTSALKSDVKTSSNGRLQRGNSLRQGSHPVTLGSNDDEARTQIVGERTKAAILPRNAALNEGGRPSSTSCSARGVMSGRTDNFSESNLRSGTEINVQLKRLQEGLGSQSCELLVSGKQPNGTRFW